MAQRPPRSAALTSADAGTILDAVLSEVGAELRDWRIRSVHRRGTTSVAVVYEVALRTRDGQDRDRLYVGHTSTRSVPDGAARVDVDGEVVHLWQFPHDPYLPGLPDAVHRPGAAALLQRHGRPGDAATTPIRTRSYRPTRRAVVRVGPGSNPRGTLYCKLLGGRTPQRVTERTSDLADAHTHLAGHLPVPEVVEVDADQGLVVLTALGGTSLRDQLRTGAPTVDVGDVLAPIRRLHRLAPPPGRTDPDRFADVSRHVALLRDRLPARSGQLERLATAVASVGGPRATVHGDLHCGQLLVTGVAVTGVLDVDGCGTGLVAHDLGRLVAHAEAAAGDGGGEAWVTELVAACGRIVDPDDLARATAAAWIGLATGPLRVHAAQRDEQVGLRLDRAAAWLDRL